MGLVDGQRREQADDRAAGRQREHLVVQREFLQRRVRPATDLDADGLGDGRLSFRAPIEPGDPDAENTLFVVVGALGTVGLLATAVVPGVL